MLLYFPSVAKICFYFVISALLLYAVSTQITKRNISSCRSEIAHLTELIQSRAVDVSLEDISQKNEENASEFGRRQEFTSGLLKGNRNVGIRSSAVVSTPEHSSKVS